MNVEAIPGHGQAILVIKEVVGIEPFVTMRPPARAMELLGAALGDDADQRAGVAPIFCLVVGGKHLDFAN